MHINTGRTCRIHGGGVLMAGIGRNDYERHLKRETEKTPATAKDPSVINGSRVRQRRESNSAEKTYGEQMPASLEEAPAIPMALDRSRVGNLDGEWT